MVVVVPSLPMAPTNSFFFQLHSRVLATPTLPEPGDQLWPASEKRHPG